VFRTGEPLTADETAKTLRGSLAQRGDVRPLERRYDLCHTRAMKTAISVPDSVFQAGERLAHRLGLSRSRLYSEAVRDYVSRHDDDEITRRLNAVYDREASEPDPLVTRVASLALPKESWK
jgi:hypothetical protein